MAVVDLVWDLVTLVSLDMALEAEVALDSDPETLALLVMVLVAEVALALDLEILVSLDTDPVVAVDSEEVQAEVAQVEAVLVALEEAVDLVDLACLVAVEAFHLLLVVPNFQMLSRVTMPRNPR